MGGKSLAGGLWSRISGAVTLHTSTTCWVERLGGRRLGGRHWVAPGGLLVRGSRGNICGRLGISFA